MFYLRRSYTRKPRKSILFLSFDYQVKSVRATSEAPCFCGFSQDILITRAQVLMNRKLTAQILYGGNAPIRREQTQ